MASSLAEFALPSGELNPAALVQATTLLECLQRDRRAEAQRLLRGIGTAQIVVWTQFPETLPPDLAVIYDGDTIYIVIIGTMNGTQWTGQIAGAAGTPYPLQPSVSAGAFWLPIAQSIITEISTLATPGITRMKIVGHSYGGAVALLAALNFTRNPGQLTDVQCLLIGAPNPLTEGYTGPMPSALFRVQHPDDVVPLLPPSGFNMALLAADPAEWVFGRSLNWGYYGRGYYLNTAGELSRNENVRPTWSAGFGALYQANLGVHDIVPYTASAVAAYQRVAPDPLVSAWLPSALAVGALPNPQAPAPQIPPAAWVNVPGANATYFPGGAALINPGNLATMQSAVVSAANVSRQNATNIYGIYAGGVGMAFSGFAKCTMIINNGRYGRLLSATISGQATLIAAFTPARALAQIYAYIFGNAITPRPDPFPPLPYPKGLGSPVIEYIRVSDALNPRVSKLLDAGGVNYSGSFTGLPADFFATALSLTLQGLSTQNVGAPPVATQFTHSGNLLMVGQPDDAVRAGGFVPGLVMLAPATLDQKIRDFLNALTTTGDAWGFMGLDYTQALRSVGAFTVFNVAYYQVTVPAHGYTTGDRIRITNVENRSFAGVWKVGVIDVDTIFLANGPRTGLLPPRSADLRRVQLANGTRLRAFYRYQTPSGGWVSPFGIKISKKNPGKEFSPISFRKKPRKVK